MSKLADAQERIAYLTRPIVETCRLRNGTSGKYRTAQGVFYNCGSSIEALVTDEYHDVPYWTRTVVEHDGEDYYLVGYRRVYIYFTQEDAMALMSCGKDKATRLFRELDQGGIGLIERKKQGQGRPTRIYVKNFTLPPEPGQPQQSQMPPEGPQTAGSQQSRPLDSAAVQTAQKTQSAPLGMSGQDSGFSAPNKTDKNKTDFNDTESSIPPPAPSHASPPAGAHRRMRMDEMDGYRERIRENIGYDLLLLERPYDAEEIDGYVELMAETCASRREYIRVNGEDVPIELVRKRFLKKVQTTKP